MTTVLEELYKISPIWLQQVMVSIYGIWWYQRRFGGKYKLLVEEFKARDNWLYAQFEDYQTKKITELLGTAWGSRYYYEVFRRAGITEKMDPWDAFHKIPFLTKEIVRQKAKELLTTQSIPKGTMIQKSSGTTGTPTDIYFTPYFHSLELAVPEVRNLNWAGVSSRDRRVMFGVRKVCNFSQTRPPFWRFSPRENMAYASIYHLNPVNIPSYLEFLREYKPSNIMGYPSALNTIAHYALENNNFPAPAKVVITTSETVTDLIRENIESTWKCKVFDRYGAVENCLFVSQCEFGSYHVSPDVGIVEILDQNGNQAGPGELGEVVCTGLHNTLQPLIRYKIGDVARWSSQQHCECGRDWPILEGIEGRYEDICHTKDGRQLVRFDTVFKGVESITEAQVIQETLEQFIIKVVPANNYSTRDSEILQNNMKKHVGDVEIDVLLVDTIPRTSSGKFKAVISKVKRTH